MVRVRRCGWRNKVINHNGPHERGRRLERASDDGSRGQGDARENSLVKEADRWFPEAGTGWKMDSLQRP